MILRQRPKPLPVQKLEALIPRIPAHSNSLPNIELDLAKRLVGFTGERKVDYHLKPLTRNFTILHDIYLGLPYGNTAQFDSLILTPNAIFIVESKHYKGTIIFDTVLKQLIRDDGETETGFKYPITQAMNQRMHLENWLQDHHFPSAPIHFLIAIADPSTIVKAQDDKEAISKVVTHAEHVPQRILDMHAAYSKSDHNRIPVQKISDAILKESGEFDRDIMKDYDIKPIDVLAGVRCPECGELGMKRVYGKWKCLKCKHDARYAHRQALTDYQMLIHPWITNAECRRFLKIDSKDLATRLMKDAELVFDPKNKRWISRNYKTS